MSEIFSQNLKRLRMEKNYTQEEAARLLGVTAQTVSRWECGTTLPDVMLLPEIARLYCVAVDDLYRENTDAYANYAQRLASIYEETGKPEDFVRADAEFQRLINSGKATADDLRWYGIIHQYMMAYCMKKGPELLDRGMAETAKEDPMYWRIKRQKIYFLSRIGKGRESIDEQLKVMEQEPDDPTEWICMIHACICAGETETGYEWFRKAEERFPDNAMLYVYGGDLSKALGKIPEAFAYWDKSLALDSTFQDAKFSKGFCYEEMGEWEKAYETWIGIADELRRKGMVHEMQFPLRLADECAKKIRNKAD